MTLGPIQSLKQGFIGQDVGHNLSASILQIRPLRERFDFGDSFRGQPVFGTGQSKGTGRSEQDSARYSMTSNQVVALDAPVVLQVSCRSRTIKKRTSSG